MRYKYTHNYRLIMHATKTNPNSTIFGPCRRNIKSTIIPNGADMIAQITVFGDVVVAGWHRHWHCGTHLFSKICKMQNYCIQPHIQFTRFRCYVEIWSNLHSYLAQIILKPFLANAFCWTAFIRSNKIPYAIQCLHFTRFRFTAIRMQ